MKKILFILILTISFVANINAQIDENQLKEDMLLMQKEMERAMTELSSMLGGSIILMDTTMIQSPDLQQMDQLFSDDFQIMDLFNLMNEEMKQIPEIERQQIEQLFQQFGAEGPILEEMEKLLDELADDKNQLLPTEQQKKKRKIQRI